MKHLVLAVVFLMALATAASAATVCSTADGILADGDVCSIGGYNITWTDVLTGSINVDVTTPSVGVLSIKFTSSSLAPGILYTVSVPSVLSLTNVALAQTNTVAAIKDVTGSNGGALTGGSALTILSGSPASVSDGFTAGSPTGETITVTDSWAKGVGPTSTVTNTLTFVPEPGTYALMGAGLLALGVLRRRKA